MALVVEAVFMNAGSSVTNPVLLLRAAMSMAFSFSLPTTTGRDRKSTRLNSSHRCISYAVFCLKKKKAYVKRFSDTHASKCGAFWDGSVTFVGDDRRCGVVPCLTGSMQSRCVNSC